MFTNREDLAWAAGLFEGEGSFSHSITKGTTTKRFIARISMTDLDVVCRFAEVLGFGWVRPHKQSNPKYLLQWAWAGQSFEHFQATVAMLWPWLGERRKAKAIELLGIAKTYHATLIRPKRMIRNEDYTYRYNTIRGGYERRRKIGGTAHLDRV